MKFLSVILYSSLGFLLGFLVAGPFIVSVYAQITDSEIDIDLGNTSSTVILQYDQPEPDSRSDFNKLVDTEDKLLERDVQLSKYAQELDALRASCR